jgi:hypothetical protein
MCLSFEKQIMKTKAPARGTVAAWRKNFVPFWNLDAVNTSEPRKLSTEQGSLGKP